MERRPAVDRRRPGLPGHRPGNFTAFEARGGRKLWAFAAQTGVVAAPVTYEVDGEQYVTVMAGWGGVAPTPRATSPGGRQGGTNRVLMFRLGGKSALPPRSARGAAARPAGRQAQQEAFERGLYLYQVNCMICHGDTGVSGGVVPDLRYSAALGSTDAWKSIVVDGSMVNNGMVQFAEILK